jgi:acetyltransferase-like isoleucine patch superfamily enzyme
VRMRGARRTAATIGTRALSPTIARYYRSKGVRIGGRPTFAGLPVISHESAGQIHLGDDVKLVSTALMATLGSWGPCVLRCMNDTARIEIGDDCGFTGAVIVARNTIRVGRRVMLGPGVVITDSDHHPLLPFERRYLAAPAPDPLDDVTIGDDVFIGVRSTVLPGVTIGAGSVIGAGSTVVRSIPAGVVAAGSPATVLRDLTAVAVTS